MKLSVIKLGRIDYQPALELQCRILKLRQREKVEDVLLLLEHPPMLTLGVNGRTDNILVGPDYLRSIGVNVYHTNRGGDVTYHGPGQLVGYPIINLNYHGKDLKAYARRLEETFIRLLTEEYGVVAGRIPGFTGVWVGNEKIAAIGCAVKHWVTMHGFSFNVNTNMKHFRWINPCGITDKGLTSLQKLLGSPQDMELVMDLVIRHFAALFSVEPVIVESEEFLRRLEWLSDGEETAGMVEN